MILTRKCLKVFHQDSTVYIKTSVYILSISSFLIVKYNLQRKKKSRVVFVSRPGLHIGLTVSLKPCLNFCLFKWLKFNLRRVTNLRPLMLCIAKKELSLGLIKLKIIFLNLFTDTMFPISSLNTHHFLISFDKKTN